MKTLIRSCLDLIKTIRILPHMALFAAEKADSAFSADLQKWTSVYYPGQPSGMKTFVRLMNGIPEFRNLFYYRLGAKARLFSFLCPPMDTLCIACDKIGPGLFIQHGFATIITAKEIGRNCWINQQVTIGFTTDPEPPIIGDNVLVSAGAKVLGQIRVGDNVKVGANAVVIKDVPPNCTVVGVPARIIKRDGQRVPAGQ